jgi:hypothetical protein
MGEVAVKTAVLCLKQPFYAREGKSVAKLRVTSQKEVIMSKIISMFCWGGGC